MDQRLAVTRWASPPGLARVCKLSTVSSMPWAARSTVLATESAAWSSRVKARPGVVVTSLMTKQEKKEEEGEEESKEEEGREEDEGEEKDEGKEEKEAEEEEEGEEENRSGGR